MGLSKKLFWIDTETTGLDAKKQDIIQLAYLIEINKEVKEEGILYIQPFNYETIDKRALEVSGTKEEILKTYLEPKEAYSELIKILDRYIDKYDKTDKFYPAGYNTRFDMEFLKEFFLKNNNKYYGSYFNYHLLDPVSLLFAIEHKGLISLDSFKLENACKYFGINLVAHNALNDIKATRELFYKLLEYLK